MVCRRGVIHVALVAAVLSVCGLQAGAQAPPNTTLLARLSGESAVPPNRTEATGNMQATLNKQTRVLTWTLSTNGLSGPPISASFHGPAMPGENAAAAVPLAFGKDLDTGTVTLTAAQVDDVLAGRWYVIVATAASPSGEIRGQVMVGR